MLASIADFKRSALVRRFSYGSTNRMVHVSLSLSGLLSLAALSVVMAATAMPAEAGQYEPDIPTHLDSYGGSHMGSNFPKWYKDSSGVQLELCTAKTDVAGACLYDPPNDPVTGLPINTYATTLGMGAEAFWWMGEASMPFAGGTAQIVMAVEAAFFSGEIPLERDEFGFGRLRLRIDIPSPGDYEITHPFGKEVFHAEAAGQRAINITMDTGAVQPDWTGPLKSKVESFLIWDSSAPAAPPGYVGDGATPHKVTGSPHGTNYFEVKKVGDDTIRAFTDQFVITGKYSNEESDTPLSARRVSYNGSQLEVLMTSAQTAALTATVEGTSYPLISDGLGHFYLSIPVSTKPKTITVAATNAKTLPTTQTHDVIDNVMITKATFSPSLGELTVEAQSSMYNANMSDPNLTLTLEAFDVTIPQTAASVTKTITGIKVPPSKIKVVSSYGGSETRSVIITGASPTAPASGSTTTPTTPTPTTSSAPTATEDTAETVVNTPVAINVLANDVDADGLNPNSLAVSGTPVNGTPTPAGLSGFQFVPAPNFLGVATFDYTVKDKLGNISKPATVTVNVVKEQIAITSAEYRGGTGWRIRGTTNAISGNTITAYLGTTSIGSAVVDPLGAWDIRVASASTARPTGILTVKSSKNTTYPNPVGDGIGFSFRSR